jgi:transposase
VSISITFGSQTVKLLQERLRLARRHGDRRLAPRITALLLVGQRLPVAQVATTLAIAESTLYTWIEAFLLHHVASLRYCTPPGRPAKLTPTQKSRLRALITAGPEAAGFATGCWTSGLLQTLIEQQFGVLYNLHYVVELVHNLGFSYQRARFVSDHLDEARRQAWLATTWPQIAQTALAQDALLLFADEASFAQWGSLGYTWAPVGQPPVVRTSGKRKGYKVFGLLEYFSGRLFYQGQTARFTAATYCAFLEQVLAQTDQRVIIVQDGARYHTAAETRRWLADHAERVITYQLPPYSPDYNPIEHLWRALKRDKTHNRYFATFATLAVAVETGLRELQQQPARVQQLLGTVLDQMIGLAAA